MDLARMTPAQASAQKVDYSLYISSCGNSSRPWTAYSVAQGNLWLTLKSPGYLDCPQAEWNLKLMRSSLQFVQFCSQKTKYLLRETLSQTSIFLPFSNTLKYNKQDSNM